MTPARHSKVIQVSCVEHLFSYHPCCDLVTKITKKAVQLTEDSFLGWDSYDVAGMFYDHPLYEFLGFTMYEVCLMNRTSILLFFDDMLKGKLEAFQFI